MNTKHKTWVAGAMLLAMAPFSYAQWQTQSFDLVPGWNAIYLHVDANHTTISEFANGTAVEEVWMWKPSVSTAQYVVTPDAPTDSKSRWWSWKTGLGDASSEFNKMPGNFAYLVKLKKTVAQAVGDDGQPTGEWTYEYADPGDPKYTWEIVGKPVPPIYEWTTTGLNFFGVPSVTNSTVSLSGYFHQAGYLLQNTRFFAYIGGGISSGTNPVEVYGTRLKLATRGEAYWMDAGTQFNRYFGPFSLTLQSASGAHFGETLSTYRIRLRNMTSENLTVSVAGVDSATPPVGQTAIQGPAPVLVRGALDTATLAYDHAVLAAESQSWTLTPKGTIGSEVEVVLGLDRSAMTGESGALYASLLRFTDSLGHSQVDIAVSGKVGSTEGLWVGDAAITRVRHSLSTGTNTFGEVGRPYAMRLILHKEELSGVTVVNPGVTVSGDVPQGSGVNVPVSETSRVFPIGTQIAFSGGGLLTLTTEAATGATTLTGNLTDQDLSDGETANSGATQDTLSDAAVIAITVGSGVTATADAVRTNGVDVSVAATPRAYATGNGLTFSGGGVLTLTTNAAAGATTLTGDLTVADIVSGQTVTENVSMGNAVGVNVGATTRAYSTGDRIGFPGGGVLTLTADAAAGATTLTGDLTADLLDGAAATSWTAGSTATSLAVTSLPRPLYSGEAISFSGGGVLALTKNAPVNSVLLTGTLTGADIAEGETGGANRLKMLQRVFVGTLASMTNGVATRESLLDSGSLDGAHRISCIHLPVSDDNLPLVCKGDDLAAGHVVSVRVDVAHDDQASNPFLHTYHPDHDNLSADFTSVQPVGRESYRIRREMKLTFELPGSGFASLTRTGNQLFGSYEETMTLFGLATSSAANEKSYAMEGLFVLNRISDIATLTSE